MTSHHTGMLAAALAAALLTACADPGGIAPSATLRDAAALGLPTTAANADTALAPAADWWAQLGDPQLDRLVTQALQDNPNLRVASARVAKADSAIAVVQAADGPQVNGTLGLNRQRFSENYIYPPPLGGSVQSLGNLQAQGSWALDFFGRNAGQLQAAIGQARAAQAEHDAARVLLAANVVRTYVQWARLQDQHALAERALAQQQQMLQLARERTRAGLDNELAVRQNESSRADTRTQVAALEQQQQATGHALAALLGQPRLPAGLQPPRLAQLKALAVPHELSADWLGRRADIAAARWRVQAAQGQVRAARAQFYPNINLAGFIGLQSLGFGKLLRSGSAEWGVGPALSLPIFEGGRLRGNLRGQVADEDTAIESYNATVIDAMRDVADQSLAVQAVARQQGEQAPALQAAEAAWTIARQRYGAGLATYLNVLVAENAVLAQRRQAVDLSAQALLAQVGLAQAMGGGWQPAAQAPEAQASAAASSH
ncbi:efflux transporter outer membrane subunit [Ottowia sp.]|uniref:efflux transporter outer membrane subunit n=1 Tax=Ottowia sp. TaxID=1898956 RepID=UPI0025F03092|nr:efflux transporter outer membrane subunit [Ottowia sp.]